MMVNLIQLIAQGMAQQNIWKKQARMNQWKGDSKVESPRTNIDAGSPINQYLKNNNNSTPSPPWAKNNLQKANPAQPPWVKSNPSIPEVAPPPPPPPQNRDSIGSSTSRNSKQGLTPPPWTKNSGLGVDKPVWVKSDNQADNVGTRASWAKNSPVNKSNSPDKNNGSNKTLEVPSPRNSMTKTQAPIPKTQESVNQPPWVKNNPLNAGIAKPPPISTQASSYSNNSQPSWVKKNSPSNNNPPSWANNNNTTANTQPPSTNQPSWVKNNNNLAPWAKKENKTNENTQKIPKAINEGTNRPPNIPAGNKPPWVKDTEVRAQDGNATPPWMKSSNASEKSDTSSPSWAKKDKNQSSFQSNHWKRQQSQQIQEQKKQLEEQIQRQEEEEKQQKRIARERKIKEEEEDHRIRQVLFMTKEEELSSQRELFDKQEEQRQQKERQEKEEESRREEETKRQEEEKFKRQEQEFERKKEEEQLKEKEKVEQEQKSKKEAEQFEKEKQKSTDKSKSKKNLLSSNRRKKSGMQSSKISHISSIKGFQHIHGNSSIQDPSIPEKNYHKYLRLINEEAMQLDYKKKIQIQKSYYQLQLEGRRECQTELMNLFASKKITNRKRKFIFSNSMQIQYALCEGHNTEENGLSFNVDEVDELRTRFLQYEVLTKCVFNLIKKKINIHLRVPLINYAEYKGVSFLVEHVCQELVDIIQIQIVLFQEIANQVLIFEKELELNYEGREDLKPLTKDQLMVKKISIYGEDYYILYIKNMGRPLKPKKAEKQSNVLAQLMPKFSQLNDLNVLEYIIGKDCILPYYQKVVDVNKSVYNQLQKVVPPALKNILHGFCLARALKIVYTSCQGQVDEESFFELVLDGNKQIWDMIVAAGSPDRYVPKPFALAYFQKISSVRFNFSKNMLSKKRKDVIKSIKPTVYIQRHDYELFEFIKNLEKYIEEDKEQLVEQSLTLSRQLWEDLKVGQERSQFNFIKLKSQVSYLLYKQKQTEAIEMIEEARQQVGGYSLETIPIFLLALKIYVAKDMEMPLLKTFSDMLPVLEFYFGQESMLHALVYTVVASYYSKRVEEDESLRAHKVVTFYEHALNIALKLYGQKGVEVADIYLSRASAFISLVQYDNFQRDIQNALKIYKGHSKSAPKIAQCNRLIGRVKCLEGEVTLGIELMEMSCKQHMKMYNYIESLYILFEMLPFLQYKESELESKIEKIVNICFTYKSVWAFKRIVTLVLDRELNCYTSLTIDNLQEIFHPLDPDDRTNEEVLIDLESELKGFASFIEIVRWALSIIAGKLAARRQATSDYEKAHNIVREIFMFYGKNQPMLMDSKDLNSQLI